MANYGMELNKMQSSYNAALVRSAKLTGLQNTDVIPNGALVLEDNSSSLPTTIYGTVDLELENFKQFTTGATEAAYIIDAAEVPQVADGNGNAYRVGANLTSMSFAYDKVLRARKLMAGDRFYIFDGNVTGTVNVGYHLIPTNASFNFTAQSGAPVSGLDIVVQAILPLTAGLSNLGSKYLVKVVKA